MNSYLKFTPYYLLILALIIVGCSEKELNEPETNDNFYAKNVETNLNTEKNRSELLHSISTKEILEDGFRNEVIPLIENFRFTNYDDKISLELNLIEEYKSCSNCASEEREFLLPLIHELIVADDKDVLGLLDSYENEIDGLRIDADRKENLKYLFFGMKAGSESYLNNALGINTTLNRGGFWDCMRQNVGKSIGRGLAGGMITGCIVGAMACSPTGPGAVACCIKAGAAMSIRAAATATFWTAADCLF